MIPSLENLLFWTVISRLFAASVLELIVKQDNISKFLGGGGPALKP